MNPRPRLRLHVVLIYRVFVWKSAVDFTKIRVDLLAALLVDRAADRPDHRKHEPELNHLGTVVSIVRVNLQRNNIQQFNLPI